MVESVPILGIGRIRASTEKTIRASIGKGYNPCEYWKMEESVQLPRIGIICESTKKLSELVPEKGRIRVSTEKW